MDSRPATLSEADVERIAELHVESIDDSIPTMLGLGYARAFFRYLVDSPLEHVLTARVEGRIESVCVVSFDPASVYRRTLRATLPRLLVAAAAAALTSSRFRRFVLRFALDLVSGEARQTHAPEITYAFTNAERRGQGLGAQRISRADEMVRGRGCLVYYVRTIDAPTNRALAFYEANGFERFGRQEEGGRVFALLRKELG